MYQKEEIVLLNFHKLDRSNLMIRKRQEDVKRNLMKIMLMKESLSY